MHETSPVSVQPWTLRAPGAVLPRSWRGPNADRRPPLPKHSNHHLSGAMLASIPAFGTRRPSMTTTDGGSDAGSVIERARRAYAPVKARKYQDETRYQREELSSLALLLGRHLTEDDMVAERRLVGAHGYKEERLIWRV